MSLFEFSKLFLGVVLIGSFLFGGVFMNSFVVFLVSSVLLMNLFGGGGANSFVGASVGVMNLFGGVSLMFVFGGVVVLFGGVLVSVNFFGGVVVFVFVVLVLNLFGVNFAFVGGFFLGVGDEFL